MNLTDELRDRLNQADWKAAQRELNCLEMLNHKFALNVLLGRIEDARENLLDADKSVNELLMLMERQEKIFFITDKWLRMSGFIGNTEAKG
ncbi:MAG: hypothetical protein K8E24_013715 [Methanobacterium paludis]|nr:hypothetical protein [Methanobacterium paludis]